MTTQLAAIQWMLRVGKETFISSPNSPLPRGISSVVSFFLLFGVENVINEGFCGEKQGKRRFGQVFARSIAYLPPLGSEQRNCIGFSCKLKFTAYVLQGRAAPTKPTATMMEIQTTEGVGFIAALFPHWNTSKQQTNTSVSFQSIDTLPTSL